MRRLRHTAPPDRRAARLMTLLPPSDGGAPDGAPGALKRDWRTLPAVAEMADGDIRRALWDRVVALSVEASYAPARVRATA